MKKSLTRKRYESLGRNEAKSIQCDHLLSLFLLICFPKTRIQIPITKRCFPETLHYVSLTLKR